MIKFAGYENLEEFKRDFEIFRLNPNDKVFMNAVNTRVRNSSPQLQAAISDEILTGLMETNPKAFVQRVTKTIPKDCWMIIKTADDPFFEV